MPITVKIVNRKRCAFMLPCYSDGLRGGRILLREDQCLLPAGHDGPHRSALGWMHNQEGMMRQMERGEL